MYSNTASLKPPTKQHQQQQQNINNSTMSCNSRIPLYTHWIHCNVCYEQYMRKQRQFYLLACDHVLCENCLENISETLVNGPQIYKCALCSKQGSESGKVRACKLGNEMPSHLKELFHPEPYLDGLNTYRVMIFQDIHRRRFMDHLDREYNSIEDRKKEAIRIKDQAKKHYQEMEELKLERMKLEKRVLAIKQKRIELEEKGKSTRSNSSATSSHSSGSKTKKLKFSPGSTNNHGITSFSHHSSNHSFIL